MGGLVACTLQRRNVYTMLVGNVEENVERRSWDDVERRLKKTERGYAIRIKLAQIVPKACVVRTQ
jgi:hypothetical protein